MKEIKKPTEEFRWKSMAVRGIAVLELAEHKSYIEGSLRHVAKSLRGVRKMQPLANFKTYGRSEYCRPMMSCGHATLKAMKFSLFLKGKKEAYQFLDDLEEYLRHGRAGIIIVRRVIRAILTGEIKGEKPLQTCHTQMSSSMTRRHVVHARKKYASAPVIAAP